MDRFEFSKKNLLFNWPAVYSRTNFSRSAPGLGHEPGPAIRTVCIPPKFYGIPTLQTVVWTRAERTAEGDVRRNGEEFGECCITHPDDARDRMDAMKELVRENLEKAQHVKKK